MMKNARTKQIPLQRRIIRFHGRISPNQDVGQRAVSHHLEFAAAEANLREAGFSYEVVECACRICVGTNATAA